MIEHLKDHAETIAISVVYFLNELRKWHQRRKDSKTKTTVDETNTVSSRIYSILWDLLTLYRASRVFVTQFHNGDHYYTGQSRIRETVTHEVVFPGVKKIGPDYSGLQVSDVSHLILRDIRVDGYYFCNNVDDLELSNELLYEWMRAYEIKSLLVIRLIDHATQETVATLSIHFAHLHGLNEDDIYKLMNSKKRLEAIFDKL